MAFPQETLTSFFLNTSVHDRSMKNHPTDDELSTSQTIENPLSGKPKF
jgi:hypothetical protein